MKLDFGLDRERGKGVCADFLCQVTNWPPQNYIWGHLTPLLPSSDESYSGTKLHVFLGCSGPFIILRPNLLQIYIIITDDYNQGPPTNLREDRGGFRSGGVGGWGVCFSYSLSFPFLSWG